MYMIMLINNQVVKMSGIKIEDYEQYWQKGGTYVLPVEVFNDLFYDIEQLQQENKELKELTDKLYYEHDHEFKIWVEERSTFIKFEKWLEEEIEKINDLINPKKGIKPYGEELNILETIRNVYMDCKNKLKELKEGKK